MARGRTAAGRVPGSVPRAVAAVLIHSPQPARLAAFYRDALGLPLVPVEADGLAPHFACELGGVYVAVMPGARQGKSPGRTCVAFMVDDVEAAVRSLEAAGARVLDRPRATALGTIARLRDPEGNLLELYQPPEAPWPPPRRLRTRKR